MKKWLFGLVLAMCGLPGIAQTIDNGGGEIAADDDIRALEDYINKTADYPTVTPYYFQHQYLSVVAPMVADGDGYVFANAEILNELSPMGNGFKSPFANEDIKIEHFLDEGRDI